MRGSALEQASPTPPCCLFDLCVWVDNRVASTVSAGVAVVGMAQPVVGCLVGASRPHANACAVVDERT